METERKRLGHAAVQTLRIDAEGPAPEGPWDLVVCDVPCTNTGVLHKRPEARWRFGKEALHGAVTTQDLLRKRQLMPVLGATTRVLWTTCSLEPEENEEAVARLAKHAGLVVAEARTFEPDATRSGGFAALLVRGA
jgi:16S rRNA (cytosine967-C5)-methyltransferase